MAVCVCGADILTDAQGEEKDEGDFEFE